jgi:hypothetical protein
MSHTNPVTKPKPRKLGLAIGEDAAQGRRGRSERKRGKGTARSYCTVALQMWGEFTLVNLKIFQIEML